MMHKFYFFIFLFALLFVNPGQQLSAFTQEEKAGSGYTVQGYIQETILPFLQEGYADLYDQFSPEELEQLTRLQKQFKRVVIRSRQGHSMKVQREKGVNENKVHSLDRIIYRTRKIISSHADAVKTLSDTLRQERKTWVQEIREIWGNKIREDSIRIDNRNRKLNRYHFGSLVAFVLWEGNNLRQLMAYTHTINRYNTRKIKSTSHFKAFQKAYAAWVKDRVLPEMHVLRQRWNEKLTRAEKLKIEKARKLMRSARILERKQKTIQNSRGNSRNDIVEQAAWQRSQNNHAQMHQNIFKMKQQARNLVVSVAKNHEEAFLALKEALMAKRQEWGSEVKLMMQPYGSGKDSLLFRQVARQTVRQKMRPFTSPVAFLLWNPDRYVLHKHAFKPLHKEINAYAREQVKPVLIPLRTGFDTVLTAKEQQIIQKARLLQVRQAKLIKQMKAGKKGAKAQWLKNKKLIRQNQLAVKKIIRAHKEALQQTRDTLKIHIVGWRTGVDSIVDGYIKKHDLDTLGSKHARRIGHKTLARWLSPQRFLLLAPQPETDMEQAVETGRMQESDDTAETDIPNETGEPEGNGNPKIATDLDDLTNANSDHENAVSIYPNPAGSYFYLQFYTAQPNTVSASLLTLQGELYKTLLHKHFQSGDHQIMLDGSALDSGYYIVKIRIGKVQSISKKLLIE